MTYLKTKFNDTMCAECFGQFSPAEWNRFTYCPDCGRRINRNEERTSEWEELKYPNEQTYFCCKHCNYSYYRNSNFCPQCGFIMTNGVDYNGKAF